MKKKFRLTLATALSVFLMAGVVLPVEANAQETPYDPITHLDDAYAFAYGGLLDLRLLNEWLTTEEKGNPRALTAAELRGVEQLWKTAIHDGQTANTSSIDLEALELIYLNLGAISLPLVGEGGLLELVLDDASVGVLREYSHAPSAITAHGAAGVVSDSGGLEITQPGSGKNASVNLLSLLGLQGSDAVTSNIISEAGLELGAVSAVATNPDDSEFPDYNVTCDPSLTTTDIGTADPPEIICHGYQVADAIVVVDAPIVETLMDDITGLLYGLDDTINTTLGQGGFLADLLGTVTGLLRRIPLLGTILNTNLEVTAQVPVEAILDDLLNEELSDASGLVKIDLQEGIIKVDLQELHLQGLNNLDPNTSLLTSENINAITASVLSLLTDDAVTNPNGLMARLQSALIGDVDLVTGESLQTGGLYDTALGIKLTVPGGSLDISGTLGEMFSGGFTYSGSGILSVVNLLGGVINELTSGVGDLLEELLFDGPTSIVSTLVSSASNAALTQLVNVLDPVLQQVLAPLANIIINRQTLQDVNHGTVFTVSALEVNVLDLNTSGEVIHLPLATASVMAQPWALIDLNVDVAKIGNGRDLHTGGYTYDLACEAEHWTGLTETSLGYSEDEVGDGFLFDPTTGLALAGAAGGLAEPIQVSPGAVCTVTADPDQEGLGHQDALRPTGDTPTRTPYTYFLDTVDNAVVVSGETPGDDPTVMSSDPVTIDNGQVVVDADEVDDEWKNHSLTFIVPEDAESHVVNIVHAYDIDTRDIVVSKTVMGDTYVDETFNFKYSLDGGNSWRPDESTAIGHEGSFTIEAVPVLDESLDPTSVMIREELGDKEAGPVVSWDLDEPTLATIYEGGFAMASFEAGPVTTVPTPDQNLGVTNSYAEIEVDKHIDGLLDFVGETTLLPYGAETMTISYTVKNVGDVDLDTIKIYDPSLDNDLFDLPAHISVNSTTGEVTGCTLEFGDTGEATCSFTVAFADPEASFRYKAENPEGIDAEVTAEAIKIIDGRTIKATAADKHGAMRLSDLIGMLPATGVTTLVWVLALGLIAALAALAVYVRSGRK